MEKSKLVGLNCSDKPAVDEKVKNLKYDEESPWFCLLFDFDRDTRHHPIDFIGFRSDVLVDPS